MSEYTITAICVINEFNDKTKNKVSLSVQYFDVKLKSWETLGENKVNNGVFKLITSTNESWENLSVLPQLRLVDTKSSMTKDVQIYSLAANTTTIDDENKTFLYDFGTISIPNSQLTVSKTDNSTIASPIISIDPKDPPVMTDPTLETKYKEALQKIAEKDELIKKYGNDIFFLDEKILNLTREKENNAIVLSKLTLTNTELSKQIEKVNVEIATLQKQISKMSPEIKLLSKKNGELQVANTKALEIINMLTKEKEALTKEIQDIKAKIELANTEYKPINHVYSNIIEQVQTSNNTTNNSQYKLNNLSLTLKTFVVQDALGAVRIKLIDGEKLNSINGATISDVKMDIVEQNNSTNNTLKTPNLIGLTETACRQVLHSIGLKLDPIYQFDVKNIPNGQAFRQSVPQGNPINYNETITVVFAKQN